MELAGTLSSTLDSSIARQEAILDRLGGEIGYKTPLIDSWCTIKESFFFPCTVKKYEHEDERS